MKTWIRWAMLHGGPGMYLRARARRGETLAQIMTDPHARIDPYSYGDRIRAEGRLVRTPASWVTADHEICRNVLRDKNFGVTSTDGSGLPQPIPRIARATDLAVVSPVEPPAMLMVDPPDHTRYRKLVAQEFTPRAVRRLQDRIAEVTDELLEGLQARQNADLITDFASQLPVSIISEILGVPKSRQDEMLEIGEAGAPLLDLGLPWRTYRAAIAALRYGQDFLTEHIEELRADPGDNILSKLTTGGELTMRELLASAVLLAGAGFETTVNLIGNGIVLLHQNPEQLDLLRADPELWPGAIEEILRMDSPVQLTSRTALCDTEIAGQRIRQGSMVTLLIGTANRDPKTFENPNTFDITRSNAREHLSFSSGVHSCLGANLARMEGAVALRSLHERFPELRLAGAPQRRGLVNLRGYQHIPAVPGVRAKVESA
ncbi:cytochrome P450 [Nocardia callitridis]|uniref:Cytochrome P450 n=1 Tax=Nocardia callitridis TaxID=648753 RepID=A0ABP9L5Q2_9NOCA